MNQYNIQVEQVRANLINYQALMPGEPQSTYELTRRLGENQRLDTTPVIFIVAAYATLDQMCRDILDVDFGSQQKAEKRLAEIRTLRGKLPDIATKVVSEDFGEAVRAWKAKLDAQQAEFARVR